MSCHIAGIGCAVPEHFIHQDDAASFASGLCGAAGNGSGAVAAIYRRTGVKTRHSVVLTSSTNGAPASQSFYAAATACTDRGPTTAARMQRFEDHVAPLALRAASCAFDQACVVPSEISHLVTVTCTGFSAPGFDHALIQEMHLPADVQRTSIGYMGCHGAINGLRVAKAFVDSDPKACVLVCAAELCSLHQQYGLRSDRVVSNALFADGAAAMIVQGDAGRSGGDSWHVESCKSSIIPDTHDLMSWRIRDHGFEMFLSPRVPDTLRSKLRPLMEGWLDERGLRIGDIRSWAIHPGGPKILSACGDSLGMGEDRLEPSRAVLSEYGNMSSPTVLFILARLRSAPDSLPCVLLGFGPGLCVEAALIR